MSRQLAALVVLCLVPLTAIAALDVGERAPDFSTEAAQGGRVYRYSLAESLKKGPVIVYFFPAAYSEGCSAEAHRFADAMPEFEALGASVVGVSADDIGTLTRFSVQSCQSRFPVASDEGMTVIKDYDAVLQTRPDYANRVSYVVAPDGSIAYSYMSLNPDKHVEKMLNALRTMQSKPATK